MELPNYSKKLLQQLHVLQKKQQFSDCTILIGARQFRAHKLVLASSSSLFKSLLQNTETISIDSAVVGPEEFTLLLEMIYSGKLPPGKHNFSRLISAADSLHMVDMSTSCKDILANLMGQQVIKNDQLVQVNVVTQNGVSKDQTAECCFVEKNLPQILPALSESALMTLPSKQSSHLTVSKSRSSSLNMNPVDLSTAEKNCIVTEEEQISNVAEGDASTVTTTTTTATTLDLASAHRERKEEEEDEDAPASKRRRLTLPEERESGQELEFLLQHQKSMAEAFRNSPEFLEKVKQSPDISQSEKQVIFECFEGGDEHMFEKLMERARNGKTLTASTLMSVLDLCQDTSAKISVMLEKQNISELEETGTAENDGEMNSLFALLLERRDELVDSVTELSPILECIDTAEEGFLSESEKQVILSCCKGESHRGAIQKLLDQVEQEKVLSPESLLQLLHSVKEAFPDLQLLLNRIGRQTGKQRIQDYGLELLEKNQKTISEIFRDSHVLLQGLCQARDISSKDKQVIEEILKRTEDTEGIDVLLSAALKSRMLSSLSVWKFLLGLREVEPTLGMLIEEIRKEPEAEQLMQAVTDKESRATEILMKHSDSITDAINDLDTLVECLTPEAEGLPESAIELLKGCCAQTSPTESVKKILHEVLEKKSIPALKFCAVLYTLAESFPNLQSIRHEMECAELLKEADEDLEEEENIKEKNVLISNEETVIEIDEEEIFEPEKTEGNKDIADDQELMKASICRKGRRDTSSSRQNYSCKFCNKSFTFNCRLEVHLRRCRIANQKPITCEECGESKASRADMEAHKLEAHGTTTAIKSKKKRLPVTCNLCGKGFAHPSGMQYHKRTEHFDEKPFFCQECGAKFAANSTLKNHMRLHTGERPYFCKHCDMTFTQAAALAYHNKKKHSEGKMYGCQYCDAVFAQSIELTRHVRTHTGDKPYVCRECGKGFSQANGLSVHLRTFHNIEDPYDCQKCRMSFPTMEEHRKHIQEFHSKEYNPCNTCGKIFSAPSLLERHVVTHIGGKPYNCDLCNKAYQQLSGLWYHNRTHHPDIFAAQNHRSPKFSSLQCVSCEKGFNTITSFNKHMKTEHADLKLIECGKCSELFSTQASLEVHTKYRHSGSQPFRCLYCSASFRYPGALQHHVNTEHFSESDSTYGCEVCGELFTSQQTLEKHYETEHHKAFSEAQAVADVATDTTQVVQVIQTSEQGASTEQLITLGDTQISTTQLFVALPESQSSPPGSELVAVNMEDLLDGTVTLICRDAQ